jgi:hypothetical protein
MHAGERGDKMYGRPQGLQLRLLRGEVMSRFSTKKLSFLAAGISVAVLVAQGCSSSDDSQATPPSAGAGGGHAGSTGKSGSGNGGSGNTGNTGNTGNVGNDNAGAGGAQTNPGGEAGAAGEAGAPPVNPACVDATGCYSCAPKTSIEFLNACVTGGCPAHFDNGTLTKLNLVGTL